MFYFLILNFSPRNVPSANRLFSSRAPQPTQIAHEESSTSSLVDVDSPHVSSVPSSYSGETSTQVEREEREAEEAERKAKAKFEEVEGEAAKKYEKGKGVAARKANEAKESVKGKGESFDRNRENPVVVGNLVLVGLGSAALGYVNRRKY